MQDSVLKRRLDKFVELLGLYNEAHWHAYFRAAQNLINEGKIEKAKRKIRKAYGGMCSISDSLSFTGAPDEVANEGFSLRQDLYHLSEPEDLRSRIRKLIGA